MKFSDIKFARNHNEEFYKVLRQRVNEYFKENNITRYANAMMVFKTFFMLLLYFVPFIVILTFASNTWFVLGMWSLMGFGVAGIGLSIMHDANHGVYSNKESNTIFCIILIRMLLVLMKILIQDML